MIAFFMPQASGPEAQRDWLGFDVYGRFCLQEEE